MAETAVPSAQKLDAEFLWIWDSVDILFNSARKLHYEGAAPVLVKDTATEAYRLLEAAYDCCLRFPLRCGPLPQRMDRPHSFPHRDADRKTRHMWSTRRLTVRKTGTLHVRLWEENNAHSILILPHPTKN